MSAENLDTLKEQVTQASSLEDAARSALLATVEAGLADEASAVQREAETTELRKEAQAVGQLSRLLQQQSSRFQAEIAESRREIERLDAVEALESELQALDTRVAPLRRDLQTAEAALEALEGAANVSQVRLQERITQLESELALAPAEASLTLRTQRARQQAELRLRRAELALALAHSETAPKRRELLVQRQSLLRDQLAELEGLHTILQSKLGERSDAELEALNADLANERDRLQTAPAGLQSVARENVELGRQYAETNRRLSQLRVESSALLTERERLQRALRDAESRLALVGGGEAVGAVLLRERRRLPQAEVLSRQIESIRADTVQLRLRRLDIGDELAQLDGLRASLSELIRPDESDSTGAVSATASDVDALVRTRAELLRRTDTTQRRLIERLEQAEVALEGQLELSRKLKSLLDRQLFWIPSHRPVDMDWLREQPAGWNDLLSPSRLSQSLQRLTSELRDRPAMALLGAALLIAMFVLQAQARKRIPGLAPPLRRLREDRYRLTAKALAWTTAAALPWAALTLFMGRLLQLSGEPGRYTHSIGIALATLAGNIALFTFLRWMVIERGLAHAHFRWTRARREALALAVPRVAWILLPTQFLSVLALIRGQDLAIDTAGRSLLMVFAIASGGLFWWLLAPGRLWSPRGGVVEPVRIRQALRILLVALLLLILALTLKGYVFTAGVLVRCLWETGSAMLAVSLLHGMLGRWFLMGERRLALQRAQARREASQSEGGEISDSELPIESEAEQLDIQSISQQTQRLVRAASVSALVVLLFWVWSDILPALQRLDEIALWSFTDKAADGSAIVSFVSLHAALLGAAALLLTVVAARNLPGLLEIGLLDRVQLDAPTRYAITTLARYAIVIIGVLLGLSLLGMRWSQLQWMAAALTVGLGFGLQEIFANFVSGLILLFERPFRVGDIITIGEFTGRVTRIRTRATTILDFDNKEVVIPNKAFITDRLTNWTLSDAMTRLIVKVGVAYGSDVPRVHELLLRAAAECPHIAAEPPPRTWLMAFGASSLDFELRVFVPSIDLRLLAQSDLHGRIATLLAEHRIEIAFPQLDLHVRELPAPSGGAPQPH